MIKKEELYTAGGFSSFEEYLKSDDVMFMQASNVGCKSSMRKHNRAKKCYKVCLFVYCVVCDVVLCMLCCVVYVVLCVMLCCVVYVVLCMLYCVCCVVYVVYVVAIALQ